MRNPVGWFEIYVGDIERARAFYAAMLDRQLEKLEDPSGSSQMYTFAMGGPETPGATGALVKMDGMSPGGNSVMVYFSCADCSVEAGRATQAGGNVLQPKMPIGPYGFIAIVKDTEGNTVGLHSMA